MKIKIPFSSIENASSAIKRAEKAQANYYGTSDSNSYKYKILIIQPSYVVEVEAPTVASTSSSS